MGVRHTIILEVEIENIETLDLTNAVAIALSNSPDMNNVIVKRMTVEKEED